LFESSEFVDFSLIDKLPAVMRSGTTPKTKRYTTVPNHHGGMPEGTLRAILKQAAVDPDIFIES
jgi:hypothetical protein